MQAVIIKQPGDASQLVIRTLDRPIPNDTQILIKVKCFALNRMDILQREGAYPVPISGGKPILDVEVSGIIEAVGKNGNNRK